jgi:hypothetical protein
MGRLTYTDLLNRHFRNIGKYDQTGDAQLLADFQANLGNRYQLVLANLASYINESERTDTTVASTQYYDYPPGIVSLDNIKITVGSRDYTLVPIYDQMTWNLLNAIDIQAGAIPQFYFPRKTDYGIWPIPQAAYTITFTTFDRDRNLLVEDYTAGTVTLTNADATLTGDGTTFTAGMVGRWFEVTDTSRAGHGLWYKIDSFTDTTHLELHRTWTSSTISSGVTYRIGESPEMPEEGHVILADGTAADFFSGLRSDVTKATWWENKFYTGSGNDNRREGEDIKGGLIGIINRYKNRDRSNLIYRQSVPVGEMDKLFATTIS